MRRTWLLIGILGLLVIAFAAMMALSPTARDTFHKSRPQFGAGGAQHPAMSQAAAAAPPGSFEQVSVTVTIPSAGAVGPPFSLGQEDEGSADETAPPGRPAPGGGCPMKQVSAVLGIAIAQPMGCLIGAVQPGSPADEAGLKAGDSIIACDGNVVTCPSSLAPGIAPRREPREVELTVRRRK